MRRWNATVALAGMALLAIWWSSPSETPRRPPSRAADPAPAADPPPAPPVEVAVPPAPPWVSFLGESAPNRLPHAPTCRSSIYGPEQLLVVQAAREGRCGDALDALSVAMDLSPDNCGLFQFVWGCFTQDEQALTQRKGVADFDELLPYLAHLEGTRAEREHLLIQEPGWGSLPLAYRPPPNGLEKLLQAYEDDPRLRGVADDWLGAGRMADRLAWMLTVEANVATALAALPPDQRDPRVDEVQARRIYVLERSLDGPIGERLADQRPELLPRLRAAVRTAGGPAAPAMVRDALATARIRQ